MYCLECEEETDDLEDGLCPSCRYRDYILEEWEQDNAWDDGIKGLEG